MATVDEDQAWLEEQAKQNGNIKVGETDLANLQAKNPEDRAQFQADLSKQYQARNSNVTDQGQQNASPAQQWNSAGSSGNGLFPEWYSGLMQNNVQRQQADQQKATGRADALYGELNARATQGLDINPNDPIIRNQVDAFRAEQTRGGRDFLSDVAEQSGPLANLRGEQRMAAERTGQNTAGFQSELMGRELGARRDEIAQALAQQGAMLSGDQQRALQQQLAFMDQAMREGSLGLQAELGRGELALRNKLGSGSLALQGRGLENDQDRFMRELGLRQWQLGDQSDYMWATL